MSVESCDRGLDFHSMGWRARLLDWCGPSGATLTRVVRAIFKKLTWRI